MANIENFKDELNYIHDNTIRDFTEYVLKNLPDYFDKIGASSSGKYHPEYTLGEKGLIRHTKAAVGIAKDLIAADFYEFTNREKDIVIASLILHDGLKCGYNKEHTVFEHPILMQEFVIEKYKKYAETHYMVNPFNVFNVEFQNNIKLIADAIASHMGKWTTSKYSNIILPNPKTDIQKCVHLCDYLASRKHLIFDFDTYKS